VTAPRGCVVLWDHNPLNPYWRVVMRKVPQDTGDERLIPAAELLSRLAEAGLTGIEHFYRGFMPDFAPAATMPLWRWLEGAVEKSPLNVRLTADNVVIGRKASAQRDDSTPHAPARRNSMWQGQRISVVLPTYNEKDSIRLVIQEFWETGLVDEVVVVNNNACPGTSEQVAGTGAREVFEPRQGYGHSCQRGLQEAEGDLIVLCEPDGTFLPRDLVKMVAYAEDFDLVLGTRTATTLIWRGANMGFLLRWGNWGLAKVVELLYNTTNLTDVGCTMRLIHRSALQEIAGGFRVGGSHFGLEMMLLAISGGLRVIQIPVNYAPRVGVSAVTGSMTRAVVLGLVMTRMVLTHRLATLWQPRRPVPGPEHRALRAGAQR